jgi:hypothetical protein
MLPDSRMFSSGKNIETSLFPFPSLKTFNRHAESAGTGPNRSAIPCLEWRFFTPFGVDFRDRPPRLLIPEMGENRGCQG